MGLQLFLPLYADLCNERKSPCVWTQSCSELCLCLVLLQGLPCLETFSRWDDFDHITLSKECWAPGIVRSAMRSLTANLDFVGLAWGRK